MYRFLMLLLLIITVPAQGAGLKLEKDRRVDATYWSHCSIEELILYRNTIFAWYGYVFKSSVLNRHFLSQGWYKPNRNFSYTILGENDRLNVNDIIAAEKRKVADSKAALAGIRCAAKRFFLTVRGKERLPSGIEKEIKTWWQEKAGGQLYQQILVPVLLDAILSDEKDEAFINTRLKSCHELFSYWEAGYDEKGRLRVLKQCGCEPGWPGECGAIYYFAERGELLMVQGAVRGTTIGYEYYYQYCLHGLAWIEVTMTNGSAGIPDEVAKFFY